MQCQPRMEQFNSRSLHVETSKLHPHIQLYLDYNHTDYNQNIYIHYIHHLYTFIYISVFKCHFLEMIELMKN